MLCFNVSLEARSHSRFSLGIGANVVSRPVYAAPAQSYVVQRPGYYVQQPVPVCDNCEVIYVQPQTYVRPVPVYRPAPFFSNFSFGWNFWR